MLMGSFNGIIDLLFGYFLGLAMNRSEWLTQKLEPSNKRITQVEGFLKRFDGKIGSKFE